MSDTPHADRIIAALPDFAWDAGYWGHPASDWAATGLDKKSITTRDRDEYSRQLDELHKKVVAANIAPIVKELPAMDDQAAWEILGDHLRRELDMGGLQKAAHCEAALSPIFRVDLQTVRSYCPAANATFKWLGARALGQVGGHVITAEMAAMNSIHTAR